MFYLLVFWCIILALREIPYCTGSGPGGTTNNKPQNVDYQIVEVLFFYQTPYGVLFVNYVRV